MFKSSGNEEFGVYLFIKVVWFWRPWIIYLLVEKKGRTVVATKNVTKTSTFKEAMISFAF